MIASSAREARHEVEADFLQLEDADGHRHWLKRGDELPAWVGDQKVAELAASGAIHKYEVI